MSETAVQYLIYAGIFLCVLLIIEGIYYLAFASRFGDKAVNRRLQLLNQGGDSRTVLENLRRNPTGKDGQSGFRMFKIADLGELISQAGLVVSPTRVIGIMVGMGIASTLLFFALVPGSPRWGAPVFGLLIGVGLPILFLRFLRTQRIKKLSAQLPDSLDLMVRSLRAGHPMNAALSLVSREMADPIGTEMGIVVDEMTYGMGFREALENLRARVPAPDLHYFVVTINIQSGTGGNLAEVLENLSNVIRARYQMFAKIRALSAEGRISATILSVIPFLVLAAVWVTTPNYYASVIDDPALPVIAAIAMGLLLTAIGVMWKMVNFKF
jgi:tight adherence protein B